MPNTRKIHDYKIIALSLVFLVSIFDKVMVVLRKKTTKKQRKKSTVLSGLQSDQVLHLVLILPVVTNDFSISGVEIDDLKLFEVTCYLNFV